MKSSLKTGADIITHNSIQQDLKYMKSLYERSEEIRNTEIKKQKEENGLFFP